MEKAGLEHYPKKDAPLTIPPAKGCLAKAKSLQTSGNTLHPGKYPL
jgi:hypothetical protein